MILGRFSPKWIRKLILDGKILVQSHADAGELSPAKTEAMHAKYTIIFILNIRGLIFEVCQKSAKTAKYYSLENFQLYGIQYCRANGNCLLH